MANLNSANGFRAVDGAFGRGMGPGGSNKYYNVGTYILGIGDPVIRVTGTTSSDPLGACPSVTKQQTAGTYVTGHVVAFELQPDNLQYAGYMPSGTAGYVYVLDDPDCELIVQEGGVAANLTYQNVGQCINAIANVNASTTIQSSLMAIDNNTVSTGDTGTYVLQRIAQIPGNAAGAYCKWVVKINLSTERSAGAASILAI